jgi:transcriptional repressor NrdR
VGLAILAPLRELDEVAYLRYASVYRNFTSLEDFEGEIALLRAIPSSANSQSAKSASAISSAISSEKVQSDAPSLKTNQITTSNR